MLFRSNSAIKVKYKLENIINMVSKRDITEHDGNDDITYKLYVIQTQIKSEDEQIIKWISDKIGKFYVAPKHQVPQETIPEHSTLPSKAQKHTIKSLVVK